MTKNSSIQKAYKQQQTRVKNAIKRMEKIGYIVPENLLPKVPKTITKASVNRLKKITPKIIREKSELVSLESGEVFSPKQRKEIYKTNKQNKKLIKVLEKEEKRNKHLENARKERDRITQQIVDENLGKIETEDFEYTQLEDDDDYIQFVDEDFDGMEEYEKLKENQRKLEVYEEYYPSFNDVVVQNFINNVSSFPQDIVNEIMPLIRTIIKEHGKSALAQALEDMPHQFHEYFRMHKYSSSAAIEAFASALLEYIPMSETSRRDLYEKFEYHELGYSVDE